MMCIQTNIPVHTYIQTCPPTESQASAVQGMKQNKKQKGDQKKIAISIPQLSPSSIRVGVEAKAGSPSEKLTTSVAYPIGGEGAEPLIGKGKDSLVELKAANHVTTSHKHLPL